MTAIELVKSFKGCDKYYLCNDCPIKDERKKTDLDCCDFMIEVSKEAFEELETNSKLQEQYVTKLESDNEKLRKIANILCDTISQLIG